MATYKIDVEAFLGYAHWGAVTTDGAGEVELSDEEVQQLVTLIQENEGETNVEKLKLEKKLPEIYEKLSDACYYAARHAAYNQAVIEAYEEGYYEVTEEVLERWGRQTGYEYWEFADEDDDDPEESISSQFRDWLDSEVEDMDDEEKASFLSSILDDDLVNTDGIDPDYTVTIPEEIVKMAKKVMK